MRPARWLLSLSLSGRAGTLPIQPCVSLGWHSFHFLVHFHFLSPSAEKRVCLFASLRLNPSECSKVSRDHNGPCCPGQLFRPRLYVTDGGVQNHIKGEGSRKTLNLLSLRHLFSPVVFWHVPPQWPHWPPQRSSNNPDMLLPQGFGTCFALCLQCVSVISAKLT